MVVIKNPSLFLAEKSKMVGCFKNLIPICFQVLQHFEQTLQNLIDSFLDQVRFLFLQGRQIDIRYFKSLSAIGESMESAAYEKQAKTKSGQVE